MIPWKYKVHYSDVKWASNASLQLPFNCLFRPISKETWKLLMTIPLWGNKPVTSGFPSQRFSNAKYMSISWRLQVHVMWFAGRDPLYHMYKTYLINLIMDLLDDNLCDISKSSEVSETMYSIIFSAQWVLDLTWPSNACVPWSNGPTLVLLMVGNLFGVQSPSETMRIYLQ